MVLRSQILAHKLQLPTAEQALPGRDQPMRVPAAHHVNGNALQGPFPAGLQQAIFAMGCFWGAERRFWQQPGVWSTAVGYAGGFTTNPTYEEVCSGLTGHTEVVLVVFDPQVTDYAALLKVFWEAHNPTQGMRQGNDIGTQYRSGVYWTTEAQREAKRLAQSHPPAAARVHQAILAAEDLIRPVESSPSEPNLMKLREDLRGPIAAVAAACTQRNCPVSTNVLTFASAAAEPLAVLVSVAPQQYLVDRVGGERVHTTVLVGPGRDPHAYEPSPRQMAEASRARVYFRVGVDFEEVWLERIRQSSPSLRVVDQREVVTLRQVEGHRHDGPRHRRAAEPETADAQRQPAAQAPGRADPHVWTSPPLAQRMAAQVRDELTRADPAGAAAAPAGWD